MKTKSSGGSIGQSRHSRAARRAASPSLNVDKSIKSLRPPAEGPDHRPSVLSIHHGAGVTKRSKKKSVLSTKKRKRLEKGVERAELVMDKLEKKVAKSVGKVKVVRGRKAAWDELNARLVADREITKVDHGQQDHADHMPVGTEEDVELALNNIDSKLELTEAAGVALPEEDAVDDDEIL